MLACWVRSGVKSRAGSTPKLTILSLSGSGNWDVRWMGRSATAASPFFLGQVERARLQWTVAARFAGHRLAAVGVIIVDRLPPRRKRLVHTGVADDEVCLAKMIEQGGQPLFE